MIYDKKRPALQANAQKNGIQTGVILSIYVGAFLGLLQLSPALASIISSSPQDLAGRAKHTAIMLLLVLLSIGCLVFYIKLIAKLRESWKQIAFNITTIGTFAVLLNFAPSIPKWTLITVGLIVISAKVYYLYIHAKSENVGVSATTYLRSVLRSYILLTTVLGVLFLALDTSFETSQVSLHDIFAATDHPSGEKLKNGLASSSEMLGHLEKLNTDYKKAKTTANLSVLGGGVALLFLAGYAIFSAAIVRKTSLDDVLNEYERYFASADRDSPQDMNPVLQSAADQSPTVFRAALGIAESARLVTSSIAGTIGAATYFRTTHSFDFVTFVGVFISIFTISAYGFLLNDLVDEEKDRFRPDLRPLGRGLVTRRHLVLTAVCALTIGGMTSISVALHFALGVLITACLLTIYSFINEQHSVWANLVTAVSTAMIFVVGMAAGDWSASLSVLALAAFFFTVGREIVLDLKDTESDRRVGKITFPQRVSFEQAMRVIFWLFALSTALVWWSAYLADSVGYALLAGGLAVSLLWIGLRQINPANRSTFDNFVRYSRVAFLMLAGAVVA